MIRFLLGLFAVTASGAAQAATITVSPLYVQSFDASLAPLGTLPNNGLTTPLGGFFHIEFRMMIADVSPDQDFWVAVFNVELGPGLENYSGWLDPGIAQANGYYPAVPSLAMFDSNGLAPGGIQAHWQFGNGDFGTDPNDLKSIIVEAAPGEARNRQYGREGRPGDGSADALGTFTLLGALIVQRTELAPSWISVTPIGGGPWGLYESNTAGAGTPVAQPGTSFIGGTLLLVVPEPSTLLLLAPWLSIPIVSWKRRT